MQLIVSINRLMQIFQNSNPAPKASSSCCVARAGCCSSLGNVAPSFQDRTRCYPSACLSLSLPWSRADGPSAIHGRSLRCLKVALWAQGSLSHQGQVTLWDQGSIYHPGKVELFGLGQVPLLASDWFLWAGLQKFWSKADLLWHCELHS